MIDLDGKILIFNKRCYSNFTYGKEYLAKGWTCGTPPAIRIIDDDGEFYPICEKDLKTKFIIKE